MSPIDAIARDAAIFGFRAVGLPLEASAKVAETVLAAEASAESTGQVARLFLYTAVRIQAELVGLENVPSWLSETIDTIEQQVSAAAAEPPRAN